MAWVEGVSLPLVNGSDLVTGVLLELMDVNPDMPRFLPWPGAFDINTGERERVLALFSSDESDPNPSFSSDIGAGDFRLCFAADLVTGAKYESRPLSAASDTVGEGDMTFGVGGIGYGKDMARFLSFR